MEYDREKRSVRGEKRRDSKSDRRLYSHHNQTKVSGEESRTSPLRLTSTVTRSSSSGAITNNNSSNNQGHSSAVTSNGGSGGPALVPALGNGSQKQLSVTVRQGTNARNVTQEGKNRITAYLNKSTPY